MKKLLLTLGAIASVAAPVAAVVACGTTAPESELDIAKGKAIAFARTLPAHGEADITRLISQFNAAKDVDAIRSILEKGGVAGVANKVLGPKVVAKAVTPTGTASLTQVSTLTTLPDSFSDAVSNARTADELAALYGIKLDGLKSAGGDELDGSDLISSVTYDDVAGTLEFSETLYGQFIIHITPKA